MLMDLLEDSERRLVLMLEIEFPGVLGPLVCRSLYHILIFLMVISSFFSLMYHKVIHKNVEFKSLGLKVIMSSDPCPALVW
jgi:hypothetical protein